MTSQTTVKTRLQSHPTFLAALLGVNTAAKWNYLHKCTQPCMEMCFYVFIASLEGLTHSLFKCSPKWYRDTYSWRWWGHSGSSCLLWPSWSSILNSCPSSILWCDRCVAWLLCSSETKNKQTNNHSKNNNNCWWTCTWWVSTITSSTTSSCTTLPCCHTTVTFLICPVYMVGYGAVCSSKPVLQQIPTPNNLF